MPIEYDLVIIGATELGCRMARQAVQLGARVALVEQSVTPEPTLRYRAMVRASWPIVPAKNPEDSDRINADRAAWLDFKVQDDGLELSVESLQIAGVDYIANAGAFVQRPVHGFQVADRLLRSSHYVSTLYGDRLVPLGLGQCASLTPEMIAHHWFHLNGQRVAIVGEMPVGVELAMALRSQGAEVMLVMPTPHLFPKLERAFGDRVQMVLEAAGVEMWVGQSYEAQSIRDRIADCDIVTLATPRVKLLPESLGLRSLNRSVMKQNRLQLVGHGDELTDNIASRAHGEVERILKPWSRRNVRPNSGNLVGINATWINSTLDPLKTPSFEAMPSDAIGLEGVCWDEGTLWYRITVGRRGTILTCYFIGDQATEWSGLLSVAIAAKMSLSDLTALALPTASSSALLSRWLREWQQQGRSPWQEFFLDWLGFVRRRSIVKPIVKPIAKPTVKPTPPIP